MITICTVSSHKSSITQKEKQPELPILKIEKKKKLI